MKTQTYGKATVYQKVARAITKALQPKEDYHVINSTIYMQDDLQKAGLTK